MPFANNEGICIHYEVEGEGPPLVLLHGTGWSLEIWRETGYVDALRDDYRLVLMDARGHGASDKPYRSESYGMHSMVSDITAVLDDLNVEKAHYWGYSMGGRIGWWAAKVAPGRFRSLIMGGALPYDEVAHAFTQEEALRVRERMEASIAHPEEMAGGWGWA